MPLIPAVVGDLPLLESPLPESGAFSPAYFPPFCASAYLYNSPLFPSVKGKKYLRYQMEGLPMFRLENGVYLL